MGHCLKAALIVSATEKPLETMLRDAVEAGERHAAGATDRERRHLAAARAWLERDYARAEEIGRRAVTLNPTDAWASHAVAHVMEMNARLGEGIAWLEEGSRYWAPYNGFVYHNCWHLALYHLDRGDAPRTPARRRSGSGAAGAARAPPEPQEPVVLR